MFITETDIQTWIQPITIKNTRAMNPDALDNAYLNAVGYLKRELQGKWDIDNALKAERDTEDFDPTLYYIVVVLTSFYFAGISSNISEPLYNEYRQVCGIVEDLKNGTSVMYNAPGQESPDAYGIVYTDENTYLG